MDGFPTNKGLQKIGDIIPHYIQLAPKTEFNLTTYIKSKKINEKAKKKQKIN